MSDRFLFSGPVDAAVTILLAHGAGGAMDSPGMERFSDALAAAGARVARFEFGYMAERRRSGRRAPPPKAEMLIPDYLAAVRALVASGPVVIGGKSMGGRIASMVADDLYRTGDIAGLLCLGYPFHPIGKPDLLRTAHIETLRAPTLICQGTRDPFGSREDVIGYELSDQIEIFWLEDGDHDLRPRKGVSGFSMGDHLAAMASRVAAWSSALCRL